MLSLLVSTFLVTTTLAAKPCCLDRQFEATMGELGGLLYSVKGKPQTTLIDVENIIHYDFYNRMMAVESTSHLNGSMSKSDVLINLNTNDMYVTTNGHCTKSKNTLNTPLIEPCIPDNATFVRSSYIGYGLNAVNFTTWQFTYPGVQEDLRLSVTDDSCIPIAEGAFGTVLGYSSDIIFIFTNFKPGISKPKLMTVPQHCSGAPHDVPDDLQRKIKAATKLVTFR